MVQPPAKPHDFKHWRLRRRPGIQEAQEQVRYIFSSFSYESDKRPNKKLRTFAKILCAAYVGKLNAQKINYKTLPSDWKAEELLIALLDENMQLTHIGKNAMKMIESSSDYSYMMQKAMS